MKILQIACVLLGLGLSPSSLTAEIHLGQGIFSGEVTENSVFLQTRLTVSSTLDESGDLAGSPGWACFEWSTSSTFSDAQRTELVEAVADHDFIVRCALQQLQPATRYYFRPLFGENAEQLTAGPTGSFQTLRGGSSTEPVQFIVGSCMNYNKFMHGELAKASGPVTATEEDKELGFPAFVSMQRLQPEFCVLTGDIVYYDNKISNAKTLPELRKCWHEQFRFPRMIDFFRDVPTYWSKDDHDFRFNDSDNASSREPKPETGIELFREQLPIVAMEDRDTPTYRTYRVNSQLQLWFTEGRDYRSPNKMKDGPEKSLWGTEQREWLKRTLAASDATWKILISPTPMVGPDDAYKKDNHANLGGFRHEADAFYSWLKEQDIQNFMTVCGDRHWQYHSIHPSGYEEFACGALNDENSRLGVPPGSKRGTDPDSLVRQPYLAPHAYGGFLSFTAGDVLKIQFHTSRGDVMYSVTHDASGQTLPQ
ncbi:alkaline phosphatase D family protein [Aureliella helgolandensis]|uniref:Alkaline phosphatase D n=1 Tax=Aureliella helgolandensis TaxID=2527968 RepID=A0A518GAB5_9BACT|nr:alkaline phosphatase D family protein [Aureliella helgolandensis]QDV25537.1 Alkaline phosphatase D precursor [Aureliella helgolandensis]